MTCECGCGQITKVATKTDRTSGQVKGRHIRFVHGHNMRVKAISLRREDAPRGIEHAAWKGSLVSYSGLHHWLARVKPKT